MKIIQYVSIRLATTRSTAEKRLITCKICLLKMYLCLISPTKKLTCKSVLVETESISRPVPVIQTFYCIMVQVLRRVSTTTDFPRLHPPCHLHLQAPNSQSEEPSAAALCYKNASAIQQHTTKTERQQNQLSY